MFLIGLSLFFLKMLLQFLRTLLEVFDSLDNHVVILGAPNEDGRNVALGKQQRVGWLLLDVVERAIEVFFPVGVNETEERRARFSAHRVDVVAERHELGDGIRCSCC